QCKLGIIRLHSQPPWLIYEIYYHSLLCKRTFHLLKEPDISLFYNRKMTLTPYLLQKITSPNRIRTGV
ncbi:MAG: hypothetical protein K9L71_01075, partial [Candidatus Omnitrophica bacterium]|nr:hypothetical protein [Candidatus Omnitrophota bacterium]